MPINCKSYWLSLLQGGTTASFLALNSRHICPWWHLTHVLWYTKMQCVRSLVCFRAYCVVSCIIYWWSGPLAQAEDSVCRILYNYDDITCWCTWKTDLYVLLCPFLKWLVLENKYLSVLSTVLFYWIVVLVPTTPLPCFDKEDCSKYGKDVCTDYPDYSAKNCRQSCGLCGKVVLKLMNHFQYFTV